jgi:ankyrin repeat protein
MVDKEVVREIQAAIEGGDVAKVEALIGSDKDRLNMSTRLFGTWLHVAASLGQLEIVKRLVDMGADVNAVGGLEGSTPLHLAAAAGHLDIAKYLLSHGATLDASAPENNPLFGAIYGGHTEMVKLLMDAGIDTSVRYQGRSIKNMDALAFARERGQSDIEQMLLSHGPEVGPSPIARQGETAQGSLPRNRAGEGLDTKTRSRRERPKPSALDRAHRDIIDHMAAHFAG